MKNDTEDRGDQMFNVLILAGLFGISNGLLSRRSLVRVQSGAPIFMKWFLYVLQCSDGTYYTGVTTNVDRRTKEHNSSKRGAKYTRSRRPTKVIYMTEYNNRSSAQKSEYLFKQLTRKQKEEVINKVKILD